MNNRVLEDLKNTKIQKCNLLYFDTFPVTSDHLGLDMVGPLFVHFPRTLT